MSEPEPRASTPAVVVPKPDVDDALEALERADRYDDRRRIREHDADAVELPVTPPSGDLPVEGLRVIEQSAPEWRRHGLHGRLRARGWTDRELEAVPTSWAVIGDVILVRFPEGCPDRGTVAETLLEVHGNATTVLARRGIDGAHREPDVELVAGEPDTETVHVEHGTEYALDLRAVMFSPGNKRERVRTGEVVAPDERVLDMFAGIGYFTLPMARAGAAVTAVERNPTAFAYLLENARRNGVGDRIVPIRADCRDAVAIGSPPVRGVDRVVMGHFDANEYLDAALDALRSGGVLHFHALTPEDLLWARPLDRVRTAAEAAGRSVTVTDRRRVKTHSEGVSHVVLDARIG